MALAKERRLSEWVVTARRRQDGRQPGRFFCGEVLGGFPEVVARSRFSAVHAVSPFCDIEIQFENPLLGQVVFQ